MLVIERLILSASTGNSRIAKLIQAENVAVVPRGQKWGKRRNRQSLIFYEVEAVKDESVLKICCLS